MAYFFEVLLAEEDPTKLASMAQNLPEPPDFDDEVADPPALYAAAIESADCLSRRPRTPPTTPTRPSPRSRPPPTPPISPRPRRPPPMADVERLTPPPTRDSRPLA